MSGKTQAPPPPVPAENPGLTGEEELAAVDAAFLGFAQRYWEECRSRYLDGNRSAWAIPVSSLAAILPPLRNQPLAAGDPQWDITKLVVQGFQNDPDLLSDLGKRELAARRRVLAEKQVAAMRKELVKCSGRHLRQDEIVPALEALGLDGIRDVTKLSISVSEMRFEVYENITGCRDSEVKERIRDAIAREFGGGGVLHKGNTYISMSRGTESTG